LPSCDEANRKTSETTPKNEALAFGYDAAGNLLTLTDGRGKTTTWAYDVEGRLETKTYHGQSFANLEYAYDADGRLAWRKFWSNPTTRKQTIYSHDDAGRLWFINYPTSPDITLDYNEVNRSSSVSQPGLGMIAFAYTDAELLASEGGLWANDTVSYGYHPSVPRLRTALSVQQPSGSWSQSFGYDAACRLQSVSSPAGGFTYNYSGAGGRIGSVTLPGALSIINGYDGSSRLTSTELRNGANVLNAQGYQYDTASRRTRQTRTDSSYVTYDYDLDSQLASAAGTGGQSTENLAYTYDAGWNLAQRTQNGVPTAFQVDALNRLTSVGAVSYTYDSNGNLTGENRGANRNFTYDDENRLVSVMWGSGWYLTEFTYDGLGRMRKRLEKYYSGGQYSTYDTVYYVYDGMRVVQERNSSNTPTVAYTRGSDLSGSLEGAGGIGGLLARSDQYSVGSWNRHVFYHADGNGNVTALANSAGTLQALYRYDPFGRATYTWGPLAGANVYRFSSRKNPPSRPIHLVSCYTLEQTPRLGSPAWIPVPGVEANSVTLDLAEAKGFFRLRK